MNRAITLKYGYMTLWSIVRDFTHQIYNIFIMYRVLINYFIASLLDITLVKSLKSQTIQP